MYNEDTFVGLDFVLHEASLRGIRVVLAFGNYWQHYGGTDQYNTWSFEAGYGKCNGKFVCRDTFFADPYAAKLYKAHIKRIVSRVNTFNGRTYAADPTIFGRAALAFPSLFRASSLYASLLPQPCDASCPPCQCGRISALSRPQPACSLLPEHP